MVHSLRFFGTESIFRIGTSLLVAWYAET
jgi:hypothetical protein